MADVFDPEKRSWIMSRVKNRNTKPEIAVRSMIHRMGYRFRLHSPKLPGHPDIVLPRHRKAVFVHGCFWHGHQGCARGKRPATNRRFWNQKISATRERDRQALADLKSLDWEPLVVWECEIRDAEALAEKLERFLGVDREDGD